MKTHLKKDIIPLKHLDALYEWTMENKHEDIELWHDGRMSKDNYEDCVEVYVQSNEEELWSEYVSTIRFEKAFSWWKFILIAITITTIYYLLKALLYE